VGGVAEVNLVAVGVDPFRAQTSRHVAAQGAGADRGSRTHIMTSGRITSGEASSRLNGLVDLAMTTDLNRLNSHAAKLGLTNDTGVEGGFNRDVEFHIGNI
jgi:hypothetical protein